KDRQKLAKLEKKLNAVLAAQAKKRQKKASNHTIERLKPLVPTAKQEGFETQPAAAKKVRRKLNLSPERRAQLSAMMKARWAAKKAAGEANVTSVEQASPLETTAEATESKHNGA